MAGNDISEPPPGPHVALHGLLCISASFPSVKTDAAAALVGCREVPVSRAGTGEAVMSLPPPSRAPDRFLMVSGIVGSLSLAYAGPGRAP